MDKFISKRYRLALEGISSDIDNEVKVNTGMDVGGVIENLDNDIEVREAGKEYLFKKNVIEQSLDVVDGLQELNEKNNGMIEAGNVTSDDVMASQEALAQACGILGMDYKTISFESMGDNPMESLRVSNEGILDTIGKGIKAIIKFIMDMLTSAWNFIKGLFGGAKQIENNNEKTIEIISNTPDLVINDIYAVQQKQMETIQELSNDFTDKLNASRNNNSTSTEAAPEITKLAEIIVAKTEETDVGKVTEAINVVVDKVSDEDINIFRNLITIDNIFGNGSGKYNKDNINVITSKFSKLMGVESLVETHNVINIVMQHMSDAVDNGMNIYKTKIEPKCKEIDNSYSSSSTADTPVLARKFLKNELNSYAAEAMGVAKDEFFLENLTIDNHIFQVFITNTIESKTKGKISQNSKMVNDFLSKYTSIENDNGVINNSMSSVLYMKNLLYRDSGKENSTIEVSSVLNKVKRVASVSMFDYQSFVIRIPGKINEKLKPLNKKELIDTTKFVNIKLKDLQKLEIRVDNNLKNSLEKILSKFEEYKKYLNVTTEEDSASYSLRKGFYNAMNSIEPTLVYLVKHAVSSETNAIADSITILKEISKFINFNAKTIANINKAYNK